MRTTFIETLVELARRDERIHLLTADLGYSVLEKFRDAFPGRYTNVGVAEQNLIGVAAGLALCGKVVFVYSIANFPTLRCFEQIRNDVCYHRANVKVVAVGGGLAYGAQGYTHHGVEDLAVLRALPGLTVTAPGDPVETRLVTEALAAHPGPAYLRLGKANEPRVHERVPPFRLGRAIPLRPGEDVTLVSTGAMLHECARAADVLAGRGVSAAVLSVPTVKPLDAEAVLAAASRTGALVTAEEHSVTGGLGSAVADVLAESGAACLFRKFGLPDEVHHEVGSQAYLRRRAGDLVEAVESLLRRRRARGRAA
jgi:transketolase